MHSAIEAHLGRKGMADSQNVQVQDTKELVRLGWLWALLKDFGLYCNLLSPYSKIGQKLQPDFSSSQVKQKQNVLFLTL